MKNLDLRELQEIMNQILQDSHKRLYRLLKSCKKAFRSDM